MKKLLDRRILSLALAIVMAFSLAGTAFAVDDDPAVDEEVVTVDPDDPIWFTDTDLTIEEPSPLNGRNTIQKVFWSNDGNLYIIIHPEYFGGDDEDDDEDATSMLTIVDLLVFNNDSTSPAYVPCATGNLLTIPQTYMQTNGIGGKYLQFIVSLKYIDFTDGGIKPITWEPAYLNMSLFPASAYSELSAAEAEEIIGIPYNVQVWFQDPDFIAPEPNDYGCNTIQKVFYNGQDDTYYMIIHPQYFGSSDYDNPNGATSMLTIVDLLVDSGGGAYVPCLTGNLVTVPEAYVRPNTVGYPYLAFIVDYVYIDFDFDTKTYDTWKPTYLNLGLFYPYI